MSTIEKPCDRLEAEIAQLEAENAQLRRELEETQESLAAVRRGRADADDVAGRRRQGEALRQKTLELETVLNTVPIGIAISDDPECSTIRGNPALAMLLGLPPDANFSLSAPVEERPKNLRAMRNDRELSADELPMQIAAATGVPVLNAEFDLVHDGGRVVKLFGNAAPLFDGRGKPRGAVGAFLDMSEHKRMEDALREVDRCKEEFLTMLGHELRNPIAGIVRGVQVMRMIGSHDADAEAMRGVVERHAAHMKRLVDELLDALVFPGAKFGARKRYVNLIELVQKAAETERHLMQEHQFQIVTPAGPLWVEADPSRIIQALINLLNNARKFTDPGGRITIAVEIEGKRAAVRVRDTGVGMERQAIDNLFEPSVDADQDLEARGGLGLGLALVRSLIEMHGGEVSASSAGPGSGSEFSIYLPLVMKEE